MGYQSVELPAAAANSTYWSFKTVTFKDVAGATDAQYYDLLDIIPKKADGSAWPSTGVGNNVLTSGNLILQKITSEGAYSDRVQFISKGSITGWQTYPKTGSGETAKAIKPGEYVLKKGEGVIIAYGKTVKCLLQVSGEVELTDMSSTIPAAAANSTYWMFGGNYTPARVDLLAVVPKKSNGDNWPSTGVGNNVLTSGNLILQKITSEGAYANRVQYISKGAITGWQTYPKTGSGETAHALAENEWMLEPGEGFIIAWGKTVPCKLVFPSPIQEKAAE